MCVCSGRRLERVEQVVSVWCRLFDVEEQGVHPTLTWHRGQRMPGARPPVSQLYQRAVPTEWVHYHLRTYPQTILSAVQLRGTIEKMQQLFWHRIGRMQFSYIFACYKDAEWQMAILKSINVLITFESCSHLSDKKKKEKSTTLRLRPSSNTTSRSQTIHGEQVCGISIN